MHPPPEEHGYRTVRTAEALDEALELLGQSSCLGVDTESDSFFSYKEQCCLIQITGNTGPDFILDPLSGLDLSPLGPLMADPSIVKIFHGADFDVVSMKRDFGFTIVNVFDTMLCAQALGIPKYGLGDLVQTYFGFTLDKKYQRHDWSSRPLRKEHLEYARYDSHFLPTLYRIFSAEAAAKGRTEMLAEEFELLERRVWTGRPFDPNDCVRIKGANGLDSDHLKILRAVHVAREGFAANKNRPPFKVWGNDITLKIATGKPSSKTELRSLLGENNFVARRYAEAVLKAVAVGRADTSPPPKASKKVPQRSPGLPPFSRDDEPLFLHLKKWRNQLGEETGLEPRMLVNNALLKELAALKPKSVDDLVVLSDMRRWQRQEMGETLVEEVQKWLSSAPPPNAEGSRHRRRRNRRRRGGGESPAAAPESSSED